MLDKKKGFLKEMFEKLDAKLCAESKKKKCSCCEEKKTKSCCNK